MEQVSIGYFRCLREYQQNIVIEAAPGSGKTFTLKELCNRTNEDTSCLFMAFNKSIAEELKTKLPYYVDCYTYHAMGLRTLRKNFRFRNQIDENKCFGICKKLFDDREMPYKERVKYYFALQELWDRVRTSLCKIDEKYLYSLYGM